MQTNNKQKYDLSQHSLGFRIWIYFCCILINIAVTIFLIVSKLIIIILWPFVQLSLLLEYLSLKLKKAILEEKLKTLSEEESDSRTWKMNSKSKVKFWYCWLLNLPTGCINEYRYSIRHTDLAFSQESLFFKLYDDRG